MSWISSLLGLDAQHNAGQLAKTSQQQQQVANQYGQQAAGIYGNLQAQGQGQTNVYNQDYLSLLSKAGSFAGLGNNLLTPSNTGPTGGRTPPSIAPGSPQGQAGPGVGNPYGGAATPGGGGPQQQDTNNPYSLDQNQQQLLNQQLQGISQQKQQSMAQTTQILAQQGITGGPALAAAQQVIDNHFADLHARTETSFYEQIKTDKQQALQQIIQEISGYGQQGIQETQSAANGLLGLQSGAQGAQASLQQQSLQQQNLSNEQLSGLFSLIGFGTGGGFGGAGKIASPPSLDGVSGGVSGGAAGISPDLYSLGQGSYY